LPTFPRISTSITKTYPYDAYHDCDITLVTLGSVLDHFFYREEEMFSFLRRVLAIFADRVRTHGP
jgi:hypothetical protein